MMGMLSARMTKAMAFLSRERSDVRDGKRGLSWFSKKVPRRVGSLQEELRAERVAVRAVMSPVEFWKALVRAK